MTDIKRIPYGKSRFEDVVRGNYYYADKTMFLPLLEDTGDYLFLIRPRRFGKSLFVSMMECYYDISKAGDFDTLFDGLWIKDHPTEFRNAFQVIFLDFSLAGVGMGTLEEKLNKYIAVELDGFINRYKDSYSEEFRSKVLNATDAGDKLRLINAEAKDKGYPLYLIVDEYDNFTNVVLSTRGIDTFKALTHADGFYREYFKMFKAMFARVFLIGVSPITLDDLSSGYNIDWGISQDPRFNAMLGFSDSEVLDMFQYYKDKGRLSADLDLNALLEEIRPWYDNYCFSEDSLEDERVFNSDMVLYYLRYRVLYGKAPRDMVDKNIRTDYSKLRQLTEIDRGRKRDDRMSVIEKISATGELNMTLKTSFPADRITDDDNFNSLIYYYGMLTMEKSDFGILKMIVPNNCIREQYWSFMRDFYNTTYDINFPLLRTEMKEMADKGQWEPFIERIAGAYKQNSSVRDSLLGEHNLQGFFKAYLALNRLYLVWPEHELNYGYSDFLLIPDLVRYPEIKHAYILELKYVKPTATDAELKAKSDEAGQQLRQYAADEKLRRQCATTQLHLLRVVFRGAEMVVCEEI